MDWTYFEKDKITYTLRITSYNKTFYTLNNRTLYLLRHGSYDKVKCFYIPLEECLEEFEKKFSTKNGGRQIRLRREKQIINLNKGIVCMHHYHANMMFLFVLLTVPRNLLDYRVMIY